MRFERLRLRDFAGVVESEISFAADGVTLIVGPNEAGKTTLTTAIDLLFDKYDSSKSADVMAVKPVHTDAGAEVELDVTCGPYAFTYRKRFHKKPETTLVVRTPQPENLTGREAHDRVAAILAESVDVDLWNALRVRQGDALAQPNDLHAHRSLSAALDAAAGQTLADDGADTLLDAVRAEYDKWYTPKGKPKASLGDPESAVEDVEAKLSDARERLRRTERDVEEDAALERRITELETKIPDAESGVERARAAVAALELRERDRDVARERRDAADREAARAKREHEARAALVAEVEALEKRAEETARQLERVAEPRQAAAERTRVAEQAVEHAGSAARDARALADLRAIDLQRQRDLLDASQLRERVQRIDTAEEQAADARSLLERETIDGASLERLRNLQIAVERARAVLDAGSPQLSIEARRAVELKDGDDARSLGAGDTFDTAITAARHIDIDDAVTIHVRPGEGAADRSEALRRAEDALRQALTEHTAPSVDDAGERLAKRESAERAVARVQDVVRENARDLTVDELRAKCVRVEARAAATVPRPEGAPPPPASFDEAQTALDTAAQHARKAEEQLAAARATADEARAARDATAADASQAENESQTAARDLARRRDELETARAEETDDALAQRATQSATQAADAVAELAALDSAIEIADPEATKLELRGAESAVETTRRGLASAREGRAAVRARLEEAGREGLAERVDELMTARVHALRERDLARDRGAAAKLLYETLVEERDIARRAYTAPLAERIRRLGRRVFGDSFDVTLGADLEIVTRTLDDRTVPFESLSGGAREQLSVIARVAAAMLVAENGGVPVILDDALGYSDTERLRGMANVLTLAGQHCQVIVLTCVEDRYRDLADPHVVHLGR